MPAARHLLAAVRASGLCPTLVDPASDGDTSLPEHVSDLRVAEARGVIFKGQLFFSFVHAELAQAVGIGEFAEAAELFEAQRGLQFIRDFEKGHARIIAAGEKFVLRPLCGVRPRPRGCLRSA